MAILLSMPLQLFPAVRILENGLFTKSGKGDIWVKWQKNLFRFGAVLFCTMVSWAGSKDLSVSPLSASESPAKGVRVENVEAVPGLKEILVEGQ